MKHDDQLKQLGCGKDANKKGALNDDSLETSGNTIHALFEAQAFNNPDKIAVKFQHQELTYQELNNKANQLAYVITAYYQQHCQKKLTSDILIAISTERSLEMIIGIVAILKTGCAYVPIDPEYPRARVVSILKDSNCKLLLTNTNINYIDLIVPLNIHILNIDKADWKQLKSRSKVLILVKLCEITCFVLA